MKSFFECNFFKEKFNLENKFVITQNEISLKDKLQANKFSFEKKQIKYTCEWIKNKDWATDKPCVLMPIRDSLEILKKTLKNFDENSVYEHVNVIVIDDRSKEDLKKIVKDKCSYLRVDNDKGFNFSMLMNIGAGVCNALGIKEIFLWNCDLWCPDSQALPKLLNKHRKSNSKISGSKLVYPPIEMSLNGEEDTENIKLIGKKMLNGKWRETIQFGGDVWILTPQNNTYIHPVHFKRFANPSNPLVNCDRGSCFITGALHLWDLKTFIHLGGLNPSLSRNFQDADLCLRSVESGNIPRYFGKDLYFYHDESAVFNNLIDETKFNKQMQSDNVLFGKIWNEKIMEIIL